MLQSSNEEDDGGSGGDHGDDSGDDGEDRNDGSDSSDSDDDNREDGNDSENGDVRHLRSPDLRVISCHHPAASPPRSQPLCVRVMWGWAGEETGRRTRRLERRNGLRF